MHDLPHLACLVTYQETPFSATAPAETNRANGKRQRSDPTADLDDTERVLFGTLREWRNARARKEGVPAYVSVVRTRPQTPNALAALDGIGPGKIERYGGEILAQINGNDSGAEDAS